MATFRLIQSTTLASDASSVSFSSIPSTFDDLYVFVSARSSNGNMPGGNADFLKMAFNGNAASGTRYIVGSGNVSIISSTSPQMVGHLTDQNTTTKTFSNIDIYIPEYKASTKKIVGVNGAAENYAQSAVRYFMASSYGTFASAITSISFTTNNSANFIAGSSFYLYGISKS